MITKVKRNFETIDNVSSNYIEMYDTKNDQEDENRTKLSKIQFNRKRLKRLTSRSILKNKNIGADKSGYAADSYSSDGIDYYSGHSSSGGFGFKKVRYFQRIQIKRDNVNHVGNLVCFPLTGGLGQRDSDSENQILISGGVNPGLFYGKSHVYQADKRKINYNRDYEMPFADISKFFYQYRDTKIYVVGGQRIQEFDLIKRKWECIGYGYVHLYNQKLTDEIEEDYNDWPLIQIFDMKKWMA